jgi:hypothetical protein
MSSNEQSREPINATDVDPSPSQSANERRWTKPGISSFKPITDTEGISYMPSDGISNLPANPLRSTNE